MLTQKSIKKNFMMNAILTVSSVIFPLITFPYVSRIILAEGVGKVSFATSLIAYFNILAQMGIPTYGIRECAKVRDDRQQLSKTVRELLFINLYMSLIAYVLLGIALICIPRLYEDRTLYIIASLTIFFNTIGMEWLYKGLEQYSYITIRSLIFKVVALIAMFLLIKKTDDYVIYGALTIFASSASNICNFIKARKIIDFKHKITLEYRKHLSAVAIFFAMACATTIYTNLDTVMLGFMKSDVDVGYYNAAVKIKFVLVSFVTSLGAVLLPRASYYLDKGMRDEFRKIISKAINFVMAVSIPLTVYFVMYARESIYLVSGENFFGSIMPMKWIMPTLIFIGLSNIIGLEILVPCGREKMVLVSEVVGAVVDVTINAALIPKYSSVGAAIGTTVAEFVVLMVQLVAVRNEFSNILDPAKYYKIIIATCIAGVLSYYFIHMFHFGVFITLVISSIEFFSIYFIVALLIKETMICEIWSELCGKIKKH